MDVVPAKSLTARATYSAGANLLQQAVRMATSMVLAPILVGGLGVEAYGAWTMIQQAVGYLSLADFRASGALKLGLSVTQNSSDDAARRRLIGAALVVGARFLPLVVAAAAVLVFALPASMNLSAAVSLRDVQTAVTLVAFAVVLSPFLTLPNNVLRGVNQDYLGTVAGTVVAVGGAALTIALVFRGWGIVAPAVSAALVPLALGAVYLALARRALPWFGVAKPSAPEIARFSSQTKWLFVSNLGQLLQTGADLLIVGWLFGTSSAAAYAVTSAVLRLAGEPILATMGSVTPGITGLIGNREWERVAAARSVLHHYGLVAFTVLGTGVAVLNGAFVSLWIGPSVFAGNTTTVILAVTALVTVISRADGPMVDATLQLRSRGMLACAGGVFGAAAAGLLGLHWGIAGAAAGFLIGRLVTAIGYPWLLGPIVGQPLREFAGNVARPVLCGVTLFVLGAWVAPSRLAWPSFFAHAALVALAAALAAAYGGLNRAQRGLLLRRLARVRDSVARRLR